MTEAAEIKATLSPSEAEGLLNEGDYIHNFIQSGMMFLGCDYNRVDAIKAFKEAATIELGGPNCQRMRHPIVVHKADGSYSFFEADMAKVEAHEAALSKAS